MPRFEYCPPYSVFNERARTVTPELETNSLRSAFENLRTRHNSFLSVSVLVTENDVSTLIPVTIRSNDLDGMQFIDAKGFIECCAEQRFRSLNDQDVSHASAPVY